MTAIAASAAAFGDDLGFTPLWFAQAPITDIAIDAPVYWAPEHSDPIETAASPWHAPCFYFAFLAGAVLMLAVGVIVAWRMIARRGRTPARRSPRMARRGMIIAAPKHR